MMSHEVNTPEWILGEGPDSDVVISTRARLARSLAAYPFPARSSGEDLNMIVRDVRAASAGLNGRFPGLKTIGMDKIAPEQKEYLLDAHLISFEQTEDRLGAAVLLEPNGTLSIMVNEEDHLRIQVLKSGLAPQQAWELADWVDDSLAGALEYGYSERYGFLTASVSNVGTGLRLSVMMHLAGLAIENRVGSQLRAAYDLGVSIRGLFGEGSRSVGDLYQVSNEVTLGLSEKDIVQRVSSVAQYLLGEERVARKELLDDQRNRLVEQACKALGVLQYARSIAPEKAITLMSPLRLAAAVGLVENCSVRLLNELLVGMRVNAGDGIRAGIERAGLLRSGLAMVEVG
jgi:protein arginine kinase